VSSLHLGLAHPELDTFLASFLTNVSVDGIITFSSLHHCNMHIFSVVASLVDTCTIGILLISIDVQ